MIIVKRAIGACLQRRLTFAAFRLQGRVHLWVSRDPGLIQVPWDKLDGMKDVFLLAPFLPHPMVCPVLRPDHRFDLSNKPDLDPIAKARPGDMNKPVVIRHWEKASYLDAIATVKDHIRNGDLEKVVLSRTKEMEVDPILIPELFVNALQENPEAFVCMVNCPEFGTWLGASPEMLVQAAGTKVRVDSLAGTLPLQVAPEDPDEWSRKEQLEQELVTRSVLNTFLELGVKSTSVTGPEVMHAVHVAHLRTLINGEIGRGSLARLAKALHPTPAVCGSPRHKAISLIIKHEPHERHLYAGFWGPWRTGGKTSLHVNIRCMRIVNDRAVLYMGGGITAESVAEKEWAETEHKALTWQRPLEAMRAGIS